MPQNTPNAVSAVRSLCRLSVLKISCHFSTSMNMADHSARIASMGVIFAARSAGMSPASMPTPTSSADGGHRHLEVHFGIHEVRHLRAGACACRTRRARAARRRTRGRRNRRRAVTSVDSSSSVLTMENGVAPSALRMPISRVRSFTVMIMMLLMPTMPAVSVPRPDEPDEHVDAGEQAVDALRGLGHVEGVDAALVVGRHVVAPLHQLEDLLLQLEPVDAGLGPQPDRVDAPAAAVHLRRGRLRHEDVLGILRRGCPCRGTRRRPSSRRP